MSKGDEILAQMLAAEAVAPGYAEVVEITVRKALGDRGKCLQPVFGHPDSGRVAGSASGHTRGKIGRRRLAGRYFSLELAYHAV